MNEQAKQAGARADELIKVMQQQGQPQGNTDSQQSAPAESEVENAGAQQSEHPEMDKLKQKLSVLQGKYQAEVPKLHKLLREQKEQYESRIQELEGKLKESVEEKNYFSEIAEEFGEDTATKMQTSFEKMLQDKIPQQQPQPQQSPYQMSEEDALKRQFVIDSLGGQKEFDAIEEDPKFNSWLREYNPDGFKRLDILRHNFTMGNLNEVADMYRQWSSQQQQAGHRQSGQPNQQQSQQQTQRDVLEEQLQPGSVQSAQNTGSGKRTYSLSEWSAKKSDLGRKMAKEKGPNAELTALSKELDAAYAEGRITNDVAPPDVSNPYQLSHG